MSPLLSSSFSAELMGIYGWVVERRPAAAKKAHKKFSKAVRAQAEEQMAMVEVRLSTGMGRREADLLLLRSSTPRADHSFTSISRRSFVLRVPIPMRSFSLLLCEISRKGGKVNKRFYLGRRRARREGLIFTTSS